MLCEIFTKKRLAISLSMIAIATATTVPTAKNSRLYITVSEVARIAVLLLLKK